MGVQVRHNARLAAAVGVAAGAMSVAWFSRALHTGALLDWVLCVSMAAIGLTQLLVLRDSRAPLLLADEQGVRVRRGETWSGLPWHDIDHVAVQSRPTGWRGLLWDGRIVLHARAPEVGAEAGPATAYVVPLSLTTVVESGLVAPEAEATLPLGEGETFEADRDHSGLTGDLVGDLDLLAAGRTQVLVLTRAAAEPRVRALTARRPRTASAESAGETSAAGTGAEIPEASAPVEPPAAVAPEPEEQFEPVDPARPTRGAARAEVVRDGVRRLPDPPAIPSQRSTASPVVVGRVPDEAEAVVGEQPAPLDLGVIDGHDPAPRPAGPALIGQSVTAARTRARLSIDELSERTRIRPHVLESIEIDDFGPCGGDFYARGHLRILARILGLDAAALLALYDEHYAHAEIEARQVFEAELASGIGGGVQATFGGPRWSLLAACVIALMLVWGTARIFSDTPQELASPAPAVVDSAGLASEDTPAKAPKTTLAPLRVTAEGASPQVVVRDRDGRILWAGRLAAGQGQQVIGLAPFEVTASNGAAVKVTFLGKVRGTVGQGQAAASRTFG